MEDYFSPDLSNPASKTSWSHCYGQLLLTYLFGSGDWAIDDMVLGRYEEIHPVAEN